MVEVRDFRDFLSNIGDSAQDLCVGKLSMVNPAIEIQNLQFCLFRMTTRAELGCPMKYSSDLPLYSVSYV